MKRYATVLFVTLLSLVPLQAADDALVLKLYKAVALLYSQDESGNMQMRCTATIFNKIDGGYEFATAAHCVGNDDVAHERSAVSKDTPFYLTFDEASVKHFYPATVVGVGYQHRGDDFAIFSVKDSAEDWPVMGLGDEAKEQAGNEIVNVASPLGLGKQAFKGTLTSLSLDRPIIEGDINWKGSLLLNIGVGPGSSGSAVVSREQGKIIGFLVGVIQSGGTPNVIAIPVSKFKKFREALDHKSYRWYDPTKD